MFRALSLTLALAACAAARAAPPSDAHAARATAAPDAHAAPPPDARTALALELMRVIDFDRSIKAMEDQMAPLLEQQMTGSPNFCAAAAPAAKRFSGEMVEKMRSTLESEELKIDIAALYAEVFDEEELRAVIAFYKSPLGAKMLTRMPEVMQKSMQISQRRVQDLMPDISATAERYGAEIAATCASGKATESH